ncbi:MAG: hypothetical protein ACI9Y1_001565 [Lentisphaeria bacterium]|jgi:hypothetical protein
MKITFLTCIALLSIVFSVASRAQVYVSASAGVSNPEVQDVETTPDFERDFGYRLSAGNQLSEKFGFEVGFVDLGTFDVGTLTGLPDLNEITDTVHVNGYDISFVGKIPFRQFAVFARLGAFFWNGERIVVQNVVIDGENFIQENVISAENVSYSAAVGIEYAIWTHFGFVVDAAQYRTDDVLNYMYTAGVRFSF